MQINTANTFLAPSATTKLRYSYHSAFLSSRKIHRQHSQIISKRQTVSFFQVKRTHETKGNEGRMTCTIWQRAQQNVRTYTKREALYTHGIHGVYRMQSLAYTVHNNGVYISVQ